MVPVEVSFQNSDLESRKVDFDVVPREGEFISLRPTGDESELSSYIVKRVLHSDPSEQSNDEPPNVKIWVEFAHRT